MFIMKANYSLDQVVSVFEGVSEQWWIAGGWAIDLFLGEQTREHEDVDVAILRNDERAFRRHLKSWQLWPGLGNDQLEDKPIAANEKLPESREVLWCRPVVSSEWAFELLLNKTIGSEWVFKRSSTVRKPLQNLGSYTDDGVPYLNPEVVLLFKAKNNRAKDQHDFERVVPKLNNEANAWLSNSLQIVHPGHPWLVDLSKT